MEGDSGPRKRALSVSSDSCEIDSRAFVKPKPPAPGTRGSKKATASSSGWWKSPSPWGYRKRSCSPTARSSHSGEGRLLGISPCLKRAALKWKLYKRQSWSGPSLSSWLLVYYVCGIRGAGLLQWIPSFSSGWYLSAGCPLYVGQRGHRLVSVFWS